MVSHTVRTRPKSGAPSRRAIALLVAAALPLTNLSLTACQSNPPSPVVSIPDAAFQACLNSYLGKNRAATEPITVVQLHSLGITGGSIRCVNDDITSIEGAQQMTYAATLDLGGNQISDLAPLAGLTNLTELHVDGNQISDLAPLAGLAGLTYLDVSDNQISDLAPLAGLTNLTKLHVDGNQASDLAPLAGLTRLTYLDVSDNQASDPAPLAGLTNLAYLDLGRNHISDISALGMLPPGVVIDASSQTVVLPEATVGTFPLPVVSTSAQPITSTGASGPAVVNPDGTITYTYPGSVALSWDTRPDGANVGGQVVFSGTATLTVTGT